MFTMLRPAIVVIVFKRFGSAIFIVLFAIVRGVYFPGIPRVCGVLLAQSTTYSFCVIISVSAARDTACNSRGSILAIFILSLTRDSFCGDIHTRTVSITIVKS